MRLAVYTDYSYRRLGEAIFAERAFALFLDRLAEEVDEVVLLGRLAPDQGEARYRLGPGVQFVGLPHYPSLAGPRSALPAMLRSMTAFWSAVGGVDAVWLLGPHPLAVAFAAIGVARRKRVALGVRQDLPEYARRRHPGRRGIRAAAWILEAIWRLLAIALPTVVVGDALRRKYRGARTLHTLTVSLVHDGDIAGEADIAGRSYSGDLEILSVGRLDAEKNPSMLADVLAELRRADARWRLTVCGEGPLRGALETRLDELGLAGHARLLGYVPIDGGLRNLYRDSHVLLHVSLTEGFPQVLIEAFAAGLPVVATAVGGVAAGCEGAALLMEPGDPIAAAALIERVARDAALRARMIRGGRRVARGHTVAAECARLERFLAGR